MSYNAYFFFLCFFHPALSFSYCFLYLSLPIITQFSSFPLPYLLSLPGFLLLILLLSSSSPLFFLLRSLVLRSSLVSVFCYSHFPVDMSPPHPFFPHYSFILSFPLYYPFLALSPPLSFHFSHSSSCNDQLPTFMSI